MYAIIDIETTGGSPVSEKITEIAVYIHDGEKIIDEYASLVNPERKIPYYITQLTGITNAMVAEAPKFYEIAKEIVEITENRIFVAHNVNFDYGFIKQEFKHLGYPFHRDKLCTVNLSRKILPRHRSYSLGKLCKDLNIVIDGRHRAAGDALATVKLFEILLSTGNNETDFSELPGINKKDLHPNLNPEIIQSLPDDPGVYYFYNDKKDLIYIGKSKNIRTRVLSHFRNSSSKKAIDMRNAISEIDYELTGSELVALLKESHEIKECRPVYNRAQRRALSRYGLYTYTDNAGYIRFEVARQNDSMNSEAIFSFNGLKSGKTYLQKLVTKFTLCQKLCGLYSTNSACFAHEIMECKGACIGKEEPLEYNIRAFKVIELHKYRHNNFYIIEKGREDEELAVIKIINGAYFGYGYINKEDSANRDLLGDCIKQYTDNSDIQQILRGYLRNGKPMDIIPF